MSHSGGRGGSEMCDSLWQGEGVQWWRQMRDVTLHAPKNKQLNVIQTEPWIYYIIIIILQSNYKPFTNAPGRSAFNRVERRMAPLSRELSGLIRPHEHFGSHLNSQGRTTDEALEKANFKMAGETLAEVWSQVVIDQFPTIAEYIVPEKCELDPETLIAYN